MSIHGRISAIQGRMKEIQSKFGNEASFSPVRTVGNFSPGAIQTPGSMSGITFEQLLSSKMNENEQASSSAGAASSGDVKLSTKSSDFDGLVKEASEKFGVDEKFIKAIIQQESAFNPNATSWVGAMGLMQLMPETARELGVKNGYDPRENIMGGVKYIKEQLTRFGGDKRKALAAYNAGPGAVTKHGGIPPYKETQHYVKNIMSNYLAMGGTE